MVVFLSYTTFAYVGHPVYDALPPSRHHAHNNYAVEGRRPSLVRNNELAAFARVAAPSFAFSLFTRAQRSAAVTRHRLYSVYVFINGGMLEVSPSSPPLPENIRTPQILNASITG